MEFVQRILEYIRNVIVVQLTWRDLVDMLLVAVMIYQILNLTRKTRAFQVIKGLGIVFLGSALAQVFELTAVGWIFNYIITSGALVLVVLFTPELRRALEHLGRSKIFGKAETAQLGAGWVVDELVECAEHLSKRRVGALIIIEQKTGLGEIAETGTRLDAKISAPLLENIFEPNTPLHDGAVILRGDRIEAAACLLPLTENQISKEMGTRHRAAVGISESSDTVALIVSEETGVISVAREGRIKRYLNSASLKEILGEIYGPPTEESLISKVIHRRRKL